MVTLWQQALVSMEPRTKLLEQNQYPEDDDYAGVFDDPRTGANHRRLAVLANTE